MEKKRVRVLISGRVQGVFFRMETESAAERYGVYGWVRNRRDGTVEALFEGDSSNVDEMLQWCSKGPPTAIVKNVQATEESYQGEFTDFTIRYTA